MDNDARVRMRAVISGSGGAGTREGWAALWSEGLTLWDLGAPTAALLDELDSEIAVGSLVPAACSVLIPGCGSAYDVRAIAERGFRHVLGVDICEEAITRAHGIVGKELLETGAAALRVVDFFDEAAIPPASFDFVFDYTMFCAITPAQRAGWGTRMATLLRPGGSLLTLAFPLAPDEVAADPMAAGPPHPVSIAEYRRVLEPHGFTITAGPRPSAMSVAARAGTESVVWWRR
jgi:SAM-dependent methyltransferase